LSAEQRATYEQICEHLNPTRLRDLLVRLVDIHSPTGAEQAAAEFMAEYLSTEVGVGASYLPVTEASANVAAGLPGTGDGARLLLYAPIDTHIDPEFDVPWVGPSLRADMVPHARVMDDFVIGLGAANPKCMVAGLTEVLHAVRDADVALLGDLELAFAGGGMPVSVSERNHAGLSSGVFHLLTHGIAPDMAIIFKPSWAVYAEEPGTCWFRISVRGTLGYAGVPRGTPGYRSAIVPAATVIQEVEEWAPKYTARNTSGTIAPEAWISALRAGNPEKPAFPSATTEIYMDVRVNPRTSPAQVRRQFAEMITWLRSRHPDIDIDWAMLGSAPGGQTDPEHWIVQSCQRGWAEVEGQPYTSTPLASGQTDGALIRQLGIPCARVGYPWPPQSGPAHLNEGLGGMGVASIDDVMRGVHATAYAVVDTLTRPRADIGL
jgi:acetylornithine deacetylase/succinyl-diaminopimelate desuccinylase-like protein